MQKTIINNLGHKVATYYPITGKLVYSNGRNNKFTKEAFKAYCDDMQWSVL